jgi:hypothetical protein
LFLRQWGNGWAVWVINTDIDCLKMAQNSTQIFFRSDPNAKELVQWLVEPLSAICMWLLAANFTGSRLGAEDFVVCLMLFLLMFPGKWAERLGVGAAIDVVINWLFVAAILGLLAYATGFYRDFDQRMIIYWVAGTPLLQLLAYALVGWQLRRLFSSEQHIERVMVVGLNDTGRRLAKEVNSRRQYGMQLVCFADDRSGERLGNNVPAPVMGGLEDVADLVRQKRYFAHLRGTADGLAAAYSQAAGRSARYHSVDLFCAGSVHFRPDPGAGRPGWQIFRWWRCAKHRSTASTCCSSGCRILCCRA